MLRNEFANRLAIFTDRRNEFANRLAIFNDEVRKRGAHAPPIQQAPGDLPARPVPHEVKRPEAHEWIPAPA